MHGGWWQGESLSVFKIIHCIHDAFCIGFVPVRAVLLRPIDYNHVAAKHHALVLCAIRNWVELLCLHNSKTIWCSRLLNCIISSNKHHVPLSFKIIHTKTNCYLCRSYHSRWQKQIKFIIALNKRSNFEQRTIFLIWISVTIKMILSVFCNALIFFSIIDLILWIIFSHLFFWPFIQITI